MTDKPPPQVIKVEGFDAGMAPDLARAGKQWTPELMFERARYLRGTQDPLVQEAGELLDKVVRAAIAMQEIIDGYEKPKRLPDSVEALIAEAVDRMFDGEREPAITAFAKAIHLVRGDPNG